MILGAHAIYLHFLPSYCGDVLILKNLIILVVFVYAWNLIRMGEKETEKRTTIEIYKRIHLVLHLLFIEGRKKEIGIS